MLLAAWNFGCIPPGYGLVRVAFLGTNDMKWTSTVLKRLVYDAKCGQNQLIHPFSRAGRPQGDQSEGLGCGCVRTQYQR